MPNFFSSLLKRPVFFIIILFAAIAAAPSAIPAQQTKAAAPAAAPIPAQLLSAKRAFISNAGTDAMSRAALVDKQMDVNSAYNQFYAAINNWKRFDLVSAPADADLVLEISFTSPESDCGRGECADAQLTLVVYDARTHFRLWTFSEGIEGAILAGTWKKNFSSAVDSLISDFQQLANPQS